MNFKETEIHYIFVDANILLHYKIFTDIDWTIEFNGDKIRIVITSTTLSELDNKKFESHSKKIRERSKKVLSKIGTILNSGKPYEFRKDVCLHFLPNEPTLDWTKERLDPNSKDDRLIAHILNFVGTSNVDTGTVLLITEDIGLRIKAETRNINVRQLPDHLRITAFPDPVEKELEEVKKELSRLQNLFPELKLQLITTSEPTDFLEYQMKPSPSPPSQQEINEKTKRLEKDLVYNLPKPGENVLLPQITKTFGVSEDEIKRYEKDVKEYLQNYAEYMRRNWEYKDIFNRSIELNFTVINSGSAPADDIDIFLYFPDGCEVRVSLPKEPTVPYRPRKPRSFYGIISEGIKQLSTIPSLYPDFTDQVKPSSNIAGPTIRRINSYEVRFGIKRLKHGLQVHLDPLYITFPSIKEAKSFHIDYDIIVGNYPEEFKGKLHVIIKRSKRQ